MSNNKKIVNISIRDKRAVGDGTKFVCDNSDYVLHFDFDKEWDGKDPKTARLVYGSKFIDIPFIGNEAEIERTPVSNRYSIGVYAGDIKTSTPAIFECDYSILSTNPFHAPIPEDVYNQIMELIGKVDDAIIDVDALPTEDFKPNTFYRIKGKLYYRVGNEWAEIATDFFDYVKKGDFDKAVESLSGSIKKLEEADTATGKAIEGINKTLRGHGEAIQGHTQKISDLEKADTETKKNIASISENVAEANRKSDEAKTTASNAMSTANNSLELTRTEINRAIEAEASITARVNAHEKSLDILQGTGDGSVYKTVADALAELVADAPESLDNLKEIADWLANHASDAAAMNSAITKNTEDIDALERLIGTLPNGIASTTVIEYIREVAEAKDNALASALRKELETAVTNLDNIHDTANEALEAANNAIDYVNSEKRVARMKVLDEELLEANADRPFCAGLYNALLKKERVYIERANHGGVNPIYSLSYDGSITYNPWGYLTLEALCQAYGLDINEVTEDVEYVKKNIDGVDSYHGWISSVVQRQFDGNVRVALTPKDSADAVSYAHFKKYSFENAKAYEVVRKGSSGALFGTVASANGDPNTFVIRDGKGGVRGKVVEGADSATLVNIEYVAKVLSSYNAQVKLNPEGGDEIPRRNKEGEMRSNMPANPQTTTVTNYGYVKPIADKVDILNGSETQAGSVKKTVADAIAKIVAEAPESLDTLKEMSDWIASHSDGAAAMNSDIQSNKEAIGGVEQRVETIENNVGEWFEAVLFEETDNSYEYLINIEDVQSGVYEYLYYNIGFHSSGELKMQESYSGITTIDKELLSDVVISSNTKIRETGLSRLDISIARNLLFLSLKVTYASEIFKPTRIIFKARKIRDI